MRALVAGGAGFLGAALVERLLAEGCAVDVVDDLSTGSLERLSAARADRSNPLKIHRHDLTDATTAALVARVEPTHVFVVADVDPDDGVTRGVEVRLTGLLRVLEGAQALASAPKVVVALDARHLHPPGGPGPVVEDDVAAADDVEGVCARAMLDALRVCRRRGVEFTALAFPSLYGPLMPVVGTIGEVLAAAIDGTPAEVDPTTALDLVHVDDAVDALCRCVDRGDGLLVHVGSGRSVSAAEVAEVLTGLGTPVSFGSATQPVPVPPPLDAGRAAVHLGWTPFTPLVDGLRSVLAAAG